MARFIGRVSGKAESKATRLGSPNSGVQVSARGWDEGVSVEAFHFNADGSDGDGFDVTLDGGSNGRHGGIPVLTVRYSNGRTLVRLFNEYGATVHTFSV